MKEEAERKRKYTLTDISLCALQAVQAVARNSCD